MCTSTPICTQYPARDFDEHGGSPSAGGHPRSHSPGATTGSGVPKRGRLYVKVVRADGLKKSADPYVVLRFPESNPVCLSQCFVIQSLLAGLCNRSVTNRNLSSLRPAEYRPVLSGIVRYCGSFPPCPSTRLVYCGGREDVDSVGEIYPTVAEVGNKEGRLEPPGSPHDCLKAFFALYSHRRVGVFK